MSNMTATEVMLRQYGKGIKIEKILIDEAEDHLMDAIRYLMDGTKWFLPKGIEQKFKG